MREIKFRAWLKETKEMIPVYDISWNKDMINTEGPWRFFDEVVLMQYTGLKDKNGVEIYEGDIVNCREYGFGKIEWNEEDACFYFYAVYKGGFDEEYIYDYLEDMEVIGNIYEHRHLLELE